MAAVAAALTGCATDGTAEEAAGTGAGQSPQQLVAARQAAFHLSAAAMGNMKGAIDRGDDPKSQAFAARGVAKWAKALPGTFPDSTASVTPSRARGEIWANRSDFEARAAAYAQAADALVAAAVAGDKAAFAAAHAATVATCKACHDLYQAPQQPAAR